MDLRCSAASEKRGLMLEGWAPPSGARGILWPGNAPDCGHGLLARSRFRPTTMRVAPRPASSRAVTKPIPEVAPVTTQILPSMVRSMGTLFSSQPAREATPPDNDVGCGIQSLVRRIAGW
jgi:hypothetical protein